jgi:putative transcriptional regulator
LTPAAGGAENRRVAASCSPTVPILAAALGLAGLLSTRPEAAPRPQLREHLDRAVVDALATGKLLVAARGLSDPNFAKTVVLLVDVGRDGAVGLVVNRRSDITVARVFPNLMPTMASAAEAFLGGPVEKTHVLSLVRGPEAPVGGRRVLDGVHLVASREALEALISSGATASRVRVYLGYAGWGAGQLEAETAQGAWHVVEADGAVVFASDPSATWQRQIARVEVIQARGSEPAQRDGTS